MRGEVHAVRCQRREYVLAGLRLLERDLTGPLIDLEGHYVIVVDVHGVALIIDMSFWCLKPLLDARLALKLVPDFLLASKAGHVLRMKRILYSPFEGSLD